MINNNNINFCALKKIPQISRPVARQADDILHVLNNINPNLQKLNENIHVPLIKNTIEILKQKAGIDSFLQNEIVFNIENKKIKLSSKDKNTLIIKELNPKRKKKIDIEIKSDRYEKAEGYAQKTDINTLLQNLFSKLDTSLLEIRKFFINKDIASLLESLMPRAAFRQENALIVNEIENLYTETLAELNKITNRNSQTKIKNSYPLIKKGVKGSKQIEFIHAGRNNENFTINKVTDRHGEKIFYLKIQDEKNETKHFFIKPNGEVLKNYNLSNVLKIGEKAAYYSQKELDSKYLGLQLENIKEELQKYKQYISAHLQRRKIYKDYTTTNNIGIIDNETLKLIKNIWNLFLQCKSHIVNIREKIPKKIFKQKYNIDIVKNSPTIILKNITPERENLYINFPVLNGERNFRLIVSGQNNNVKKSLYVDKDKLVKFNAKTINSRKRKDTQMNYHSQEEINNSGLKELLLLAKAKLESIPCKLSGKNP